MGKSTISMVMFNSYVKLAEGMDFDEDDGDFGESQLVGG